MTNKQVERNLVLVQLLIWSPLLCGYVIVVSPSSTHLRLFNWACGSRSSVTSLMCTSDPLKTEIYLYDTPMAEDIGSDPMEEVDKELTLLYQDKLNYKKDTGLIRAVAIMATKRRLLLLRTK